MSPLLTDYYQLTMLQAYFDEGLQGEASFEFFVRRLPPGRHFLLAAGLEQALEYLQGLRFSEEDIDWLAQLGFHHRFLASLQQLKFTGDVDAMPEGTVFFADEPILRVTAPLPQAQLVETRLINLLQYPTLVASKAARARLVAPKSLLVDFGLRRSHGAEAGLLSARASYVAGFDATATVLAGQRWGIPLSGTMAHSYVQVHDTELGAFEWFARSHPQSTTLLIDTYDTEAAARSLVPMVHRLMAEGIAIGALRLDSGDLLAHARTVRAILDDGGLPQVRLFASGNLDEFRLAELLGAGAPIDGFGLGTHVNTSADQPFLDCVYKLQAYEGQARRKRSEGKATWPGRKQVYRQTDAQGYLSSDLLTLAHESAAGAPLLAPVMRAGRRLGPAPDLLAVRRHAAAELARLPLALRGLGPAPAYPVQVSGSLHRLADQVDAEVEARMGRLPTLLPL